MIDTTTLPTIPWLTDWDEATRRARAEKKPIIVDVYQDDCGGCIRLEEETLADPAVREQIAERFVPVRLHLFHDRAITREWQIFWTPTVLFGDRSGKIRYSSVNYLPAPEFLDVLDIGEAMVAMRWKEYETAIGRLRDVQERHPDGPMTAEAIYWRGMAEYFRDAKDPRAAKRVWAEIQERFPDSIWAKRQP
ncbi:MAG TPA: thioredoxin family protein [Thermomicrobiales bacterium]|nr:thioredoxin family protein [Thermomicrobiales bacterium]